LKFKSFSLQYTFSQTDSLFPDSLFGPTPSPVSTAIVVNDSSSGTLLSATTICSVCPNGITVTDLSTTIVGGLFEGITCSDIVEEASNYEASSTACDFVLDTESTCCPQTADGPSAFDNIIVATQQPIAVDQGGSIFNTMQPTTNIKVPTISPTLQPTKSKLPSFSPSYSPSNTKLPSYQPSLSLIPTNINQYSGLVITLTGISYINDVNEWEESTARYYESIYNSVDTSTMIDNAIVEIKLTNQNTKPISRRLLQHGRSKLESNGGRRIQDDDSDTSVEVTYTQITSYTSIEEGEDTVNDILQLPLSTTEYQEGYINELKTLEGYDNLVSVSDIYSTSTDTNVDGAQDGSNNNTSSSSSLPVSAIAGIIIGVCVFTMILLGSVVYWRSRKHENEGNINHDNENQNTRGPTTSLQLKTQAKDTTYGDMSVASGDYSHNFGNTADGNHNNISEELVTIYTPSGKLGMIIDSPDDGAPVIHNIKDGSPIYDKINVGDRLVAVDDEDTRNMTAIKVSKLISRKSDCERKLTVIRYVSG